MSRARSFSKLINKDNYATYRGSDSVSDISAVSLPKGTLNFRNKIINGDMQIDQRNAGGAVTHSGASNQYLVDRWYQNATGTGQPTSQQVTDAPSGFTNSLKITTSTPSSIETSNVALVSQYIEGFNAADFMFGTSDAKTLTVSFWVKSSLTGKFSCIVNTGSSPMTATHITYNINLANTWEYKTLTIPPCTTGTWNKDNNRGFAVGFDIGSGTDHYNTEGVWSSSPLGFTDASCVNLLETNGATLYITGVQLEEGPVATPFEHRPYGLELSLCQRYYEKFEGTMNIGDDSGSGNHHATVFFKVEKRDIPTTAYSNLYDSIQNISKQKLEVYRANYNITVNDLEIKAEL